MPQRHKSEDTDNGRRRFLQGTGAAAVSLGLAGCTGGDQTDTPTDTPSPTDTPDQTPTPAEGGEIPEGGTFQFGMSQPPKGVNPLSTSSAYSWVILDLIYESGTSVDPVNFKVHPNVYTDWEFERLDETGDNDQPNVNIRFNVRDGLTWNDGEDFTVEDVIFTYNFVKEQKPGRYLSTVSPIIEVVEDEGDWDVRMKLNKPIGTYASTQLSLPLLPKHQWEGVDDYKAYAPQDNGGPVGLGPGVLKKYEPDTAVGVSFADRAGEYTLSELSWREETNGILAGGPFVDELQIKIFGSDSALNQAFLQDRSIDTMYGGINTSKIPEVKEKEGLSLINGFDTGYGHYSFNMRRKPLDDITFRQVLGFAFDDVLWIDRLQNNFAFEGDFVMPPGYVAVRPESSSEDAEILEDPATQAFHFRQSQPGVPNVEGIRKFLKNGGAITGESGTYVGKEYPGSLTGVTTSQSGGKHDYTFGEPKSDVLKDNPNADKEIRVNGKTIPELTDGDPLTMFVYPAKTAPKTAKMVDTYVSALQDIGIPVERQVMTFNTMITKVYSEENFDMFPMGWVSLSPFAVSTLYGLFHSDNADNHTTKDVGDEKNTGTFLNNPMGYGLETTDAGADDLISQARTTMETQKRNSLARQAVEKIYLDFPTMVTNYDKIKWPVNSGDWDGYVGNIPGPGATYLSTQFMQVHKAEE